MTSALVGSRPFALAVDDPAGTAFRWADAEAGAVPEEAGSEAVPGTAELRVSPLLGARVLLEAADEIVGTGPGFAGCAEAQPETTARAAVAMQRIRRADRCRGRCDRILPFTIIFSVGRALAPLCHRDMARHDGKSAKGSLKRLRCVARGRCGDDDRGVLAAGVVLETALAPSGMLDLWSLCFRLVEFPRTWRTTCRIGVTR